VEVEAGEASGLQDLLGVERRVWLGRIGVIAPSFDRSPLRTLCDEYVDHYEVAP
jgi:hypothetical protein